MIAGAHDAMVADLRAAKQSVWRIVALHHPLFQTARTHIENRWIRPLSPLLEQYGVDLLMEGHVHNQPSLRTSSLSLVTED
ncbi:metallophosphoesterase [Geothrix sp. PMB-07]|uniref:metallophosphoesterase n=1 Tax=Geothrix sp. PMB-07 TaxID=3068640 RepID=UPI00274160C2|nr:metallophosphoesterase [Geothrix sp. PMB-07]WLT31519.1 metallophosphoesterase [Geothrix sp. PMB-07]